MDLAEQRPSQNRIRESTILVADDDFAILSLVAELLRQHQFGVLTASNGAQALGHARNHGHKIDLLLTDLEMPDMNGVQLAAAIRQFLPNVAVVLMSGSSGIEAVASVSTFLRKPFNAQDLVETIARSLGDALNPADAAS